MAHSRAVCLLPAGARMAHSRTVSVPLPARASKMASF